MRFLTNPFVLVFLGGGTGSVARYLMNRFIPSTWAGSAFPIPILMVNVVASLVLGAVVGWTLARQTTDEARLLIGVGLCGGLSTFSSFSQDTVVLLQTGRVGAALLNIGLNVLLCLLASAAGLWIGR